MQTNTAANSVGRQAIAAFCTYYNARIDDPKSHFAPDDFELTLVLDRTTGEFEGEGRLLVFDATYLPDDELLEMLFYCVAEHCNDREGETFYRLAAFADACDCTVTVVPVPEAQRDAKGYAMRPASC